MRGTLHVQGRSDPVVVTIEVDARGVHARSGEDERWTLARDELSLEGGGFEGDMVFCRDGDGALTVACSDDAFLGALEAVADERLRDELAKVRGQHAGHARARRFGIAFAVGLVGLILIGVGVLFFAAPRMLASGVDAVPVEVDRQLGDAAASSLETEGPRLEDPVVVGFVERVVERLEPHAAVRGFDFRVRVVESETVNAFALPGGQIVVYTGLIERAERPEQVAGVIAHEMAHVTLRHGMRNVAHRAGLMLAVSLLLGDQSGWVELATDMAILAQSNDYSREQEAAADAEGVRMMIAARIDPAGLAEFFRALSEQEGTELTGAMSWLSTHPDHASRIAHVRELSEGRGPWRPIQVDWPQVQAAVRE